jgi:hypothetical protein
VSPQKINLIKENEEVNREIEVLKAKAERFNLKELNKKSEEAQEEIRERK